MLDVERIDETTFRVTVEGATITTHEVTVEPEVRDRLAGDDAAAEELVEASFEFLLEREPNTSILRSFDLPVIGRYVPEYEKTIRKRMEARAG